MTDDAIVRVIGAVFALIGLLAFLYLINKDSKRD